MNIIPREDYVVVKFEEKKQEVVAGIALPEQKQDEGALVVAVVIASGIKDIEAGERVLVRKDWVKEFGDVFIMSKEDVLAKIK